MCSTRTIVGRTALLLLLLFLVLSLVSPALHAQVNDRVIHLWVDPHYGNDTQAVANQFNPNGTLNCTSSPNWPNDFVDPTQGSAVLLHAAWPFRTVTAAIAYLPTLPYTSTTTGVVWKYAIIHCLPGMYSPGPTASGDYNFDSGTGRLHYKHNGLPANGETFPIRLPDNVSLQGTSALNTMFHAAKEAGPIFSFGFAGGGPAFSGQNSFIDCVSIFGAQAPTEDPPPESVAGIYCGKLMRCYPTITNCFIFGNHAGLVLDAPDELTPPWHSPIVINNSFIWNRAGIWNGQSTVSPGSLGYSRPVLIDNIFDATEPLATGVVPGQGETFPPGWPQGIGISDFEGIALEDLTISSPTTGDFNAYETRGPSGGIAGLGGFNWGFPIAGALPASAVPAGLTGVWTTPGIDISPFTGNLITLTGAPNGRRGTLYIRDCLRNGPFAVGRTGQFDRSPGDFRLCPSVAPATVRPALGVPPGGPTGSLNPLVNRGWWSQGGVAVTMANGVVMTRMPGWLPLDQQSRWPYHKWDGESFEIRSFDCEGFGNLRIQPHSVYPVHPAGTDIDIGADELGGLIIPGHRFGTTHFIDQTGGLPTSVVSMDNKTLWHFGPPQSTFTAAQIPRYRNISGGFPWTTPAAGWSYGSGSYYVPTVVDVTPHLYLDIHPYWIGALAGMPSNPLWQYCLGAPTYNQSLYWDSAAPVINPAGSYPMPLAPFRWLDWSGTSQTTGRITDLGQTAPPPIPVFTLFDQWCRAANLQGVPPVPVPLMHTFTQTFSGNTVIARRYTVEHDANGPPWTQSIPTRNLQSYYVAVQQGQ